MILVITGHVSLARSFRIDLKTILLLVYSDIDTTPETNLRSEQYITAWASNSFRNNKVDS